jgi:SRSO17 transposase
MNFHGLRQVQHRLNNFLGELVTMMGRSERAHWATMYIRGLLLDGDRKSIQPMAQRIGGDLESMQQFVSDSPWDVALVQEQLCVKLKRDFPVPETWIIDEVSFPKAGKESVGVAWQYCGALGKKANCQVAVSLHAATQEFSVPVDWRLYLPKEWTNDRGRCDKAKVPKEVVHQTKNQLALELVKDARDWGLPLAPVVADSAYGNDYAFREGLREEGLSYVVAVEPNSKAWTSDPAQEPLNKLSAQEALLQWSKLPGRFPPRHGKRFPGVPVPRGPWCRALAGWGCGPPMEWPPPIATRSAPKSGFSSSGRKGRMPRLATGWAGSLPRRTTQPHRHPRWKILSGSPRAAGGWNRTTVR